MKAHSAPLRWCRPVAGLLAASFFCFATDAFPHKRGTYLRVHIESEPVTLDPAKVTGIREFQILLALFEGLTRYDPKTLLPLPGTAEKWDLSPDGLHYTFHLRKNAKWSDGKPVTAQDFWESWERLLNPKNKAPYNTLLFYLKGARQYAEGKQKDPKEIGMKVRGPHVFEVFLESPVSYFLNLTAFPALVPTRSDIPEVHGVGNGAFLFHLQDPHQGILLLPNPHYWGEKEVQLSGIQFRPFVDFRDALKFYGATGIDILAELPPVQVALLRFRSDFRSGPLLRTDYFLVNCKKPPFDKKEVRQALAYAIQREFITKNVLKRGDIPYGFLVPPGIPGYKNPVRGETFNAAKARALFQKAGFGPEKPFPPFSILHQNVDDRRMAVDAVREMWKKYLGIEGKNNPQNWDNYIKGRGKRDFQLSYGAWIGDYVDPSTFLELFVSNNPQNYSGWSNASYDALVEKAKNTIDTAKRMELFRQAEAILLEEAPAIPVFVKSKTYLIQPYVRGFYPNLLDLHPMRDVYSLRP